MRKTNHLNQFKILAFAAVFIIMSITAFAQNRETPPSDASSTDNPSASQDTSFNSFAAKYAMDLAQQTGLSSDKADKIRQILIDYHNNITDTRQDFLRGKLDPRSQNADNNGMNRDNANNNQDVTGGRAGNTNGTSQASVAQDLMSEYQKADMKADKNILDVFDNDSQKAKYVQVKRQWWQGVKDRVFSATNETSGDNQKILGGQQSK